jgi:hypothetical protein
LPGDFNAEATENAEVTEDAVMQYVPLWRESLRRGSGDFNAEATENAEVTEGAVMQYVRLWREDVVCWQRFSEGVLDISLVPHGNLGSESIYWSWVPPPGVFFVRVAYKGLRVPGFVRVASKGDRDSDQGIVVSG